MVTKSLICQLVETQVVRYLAGEALSNEALRQLDDHIGGCRECQRFLEAKKSELTSALRPADATPKSPRDKVLQAIVDARRLDEPDPTPQRAAPTPPAAEPKAEPAPTSGRAANLQWKPLALSVALALVLVAMSALTSNPATVFGRKASEALASRGATTNEPAAAPAPVTENPAPTAEAESSLPAPNPGDPGFIGPAAPAPGELETVAQDPKDVTTAPEAEPTVAAPPVEAPRVAVRSRARSPRPAVRRASPPKPAPSQPTIRVYDANGKPL